MDIAEKLRYEAMNNHMVESNYTEEGKLMIDAADVIHALRENLREVSIKRDTFRRDRDELVSMLSGVHRNLGSRLKLYFESK